MSIEPAIYVVLRETDTQCEVLGMYQKISTARGQATRCKRYDGRFRFRVVTYVANVDVPRVVGVPSMQIVSGVCGGCGRTDACVETHPRSLLCPVCVFTANEVIGGLGHEWKGQAR